MRFAKLFILYFVFCAEVRVVAKELDAVAPVYFPKGCWGYELPCGVKNIDSKKKVIDVSGAKITLTKQSILNRIDAKTIRVVDGKALIETDSSLRWASLFGGWQCINKCLLLVEKTELNVRVAALKGDVQVKRVGDDQNYSLPAGFWVILSEVTSDGKGFMEFPQSLPIESTLKEYAELFEGNWSQFRAEATKMVPKWTHAAEVASQWHKREAKRDIAAYYAEQARKLDERRKVESADLKLRQIFRQENYMNQ